MTVLGIVGCAAEKFTEESEFAACKEIHRLIRTEKPKLVVSGACPMGGIDRWTIQAAILECVPHKEFAPEVHQWNPPGKIGFQARNIQIAHASDLLVNIVLDTYPPGFPADKRFKVCYHCKTSDHIKSGGCWTMKYAASVGRKTQLLVIPQHNYEWV